MAREIELPRGFHATIAEEHDVTVQGQWDLEEAGQRALGAQAHIAMLQVEEVRGVEAAMAPAERADDQALQTIIDDNRSSKKKKEQATLDLSTRRRARADLALALAYKRLAKEDRDAIDQGEMVRLFVFLMEWDVTDHKGESIPLPEWGTPITEELIRQYARSFPNDCMKAVIQGTRTVKIEDVDFGKSPEAMLPKTDATLGEDSAD